MCGHNKSTVDIIRLPNKFAWGGGMACYTEPALYTNPAGQHNREQQTVLQNNPCEKAFKKLSNVTFAKKEIQ